MLVGKPAASIYAYNYFGIFEYYLSYVYVCLFLACVQFAFLSFMHYCNHYFPLVIFCFYSIIPDWRISKRYHQGQYLQNDF